MSIDLTLRTSSTSRQRARIRRFDVYLAAVVSIGLAAGAFIATRADASGLLRAIGMLAVLAMIVIAVRLPLRGRLLKPLARLLTALSDGSAHIESATAEVAKDAQSLASVTSREAAAIEETASTVEQLAAMTQQNAEHARETDRLVAETRAAVTEANDSMSALFDAIQEIKRASAQTSEIVRTIDEIALQTNLLALNAAVEAARAGQHGAGFAIVADEVRTLARRAAVAAKDTADLIERTNHEVVEAASAVEQTRRQFEDVDQCVEKSSALVSQITRASLEQARGIDQVNVAVTEIDTVVQQTVANAEHSAATAQLMMSQSRDIAAAIERLRTMMDADEEVRDEERQAAATTVQLTIAANTLIADSFRRWTADTPLERITTFSCPWANRPTVDFVLLLQALASGGLEFDYELHVVPNNERAKNEVVQGYADLDAETVWDTDVVAHADVVVGTAPVIGDGEFEKGIYTLPANRRLLEVTSLDDLRGFVGATVISWAADMRALQAMGLKRLERVFKEEGLFPLLEQRRADFTLLEFGATGDMSVSRGGVKLVPVPGCKISLPGSRSWIISKTSPHVRAIAQALERGMQTLRREGRLERAYRESGFFHPKVIRWKRLL